MKQKIHIGLVLSSYPGSSETFFYNKLNGLVKSGFNVSLFLSKQIILPSCGSESAIDNALYPVKVPTSKIFLILFNLIIN